MHLGGVCDIQFHHKEHYAILHEFRTQFLFALKREYSKLICNGANMTKC